MDVPFKEQSLVMHALIAPWTTVPFVGQILEQVTVQEPQPPSPQANFDPVRPKSFLKNVNKFNL